MFQETLAREHVRQRLREADHERLLGQVRRGRRAERLVKRAERARLRADRAVARLAH